MKSPRPYPPPRSTYDPYCMLIADDHAVVRLGLKTIISNTYPDAQIEEAPNGDEVIAKLKSRPFDLLILDINMRRMESFSLVGYFRREFPALKVLIFTTNNELIFATRFLRSGVSGYLLKQSAETEIIVAIDRIRNGKQYVSDSLAMVMAGLLVSEEKYSPFDSLTDREFEVVLQLLRGNTTGDIARILHLNRSTVGTHKYRILKKLKIDNSVDLLRLARQYNVF